MAFTKAQLREKAIDLLYNSEDGGKIGGVYCTISDLETIIFYIEHEGMRLAEPYGSIAEVLGMCSDYTLPRSTWL